MTSATLLTISLEENEKKEYIDNIIGSYDGRNLTSKDSILIKFHTWWLVEETDPSRLVHLKHILVTVTAGVVGKEQNQVIIGHC